MAKIGEEGLHTSVLEITSEMERLFHPAAQEVFLRDIQAIQMWIAGRLEALKVSEGDEVNLSLNAWNEKGYGLQSVRLMVERAIPVLLPDEADHPTIGVIAPGLLESAGGFAVGQSFPIEKGRAERVMALSDTLVADSVSPGQMNIPGDPMHLAHALRARQELHVSGPYGVRMLMEVKNAPIEAIRYEAQSAVYACLFKKGAPSLAESLDRALGEEEVEEEV